ncbi:hypothetical protein ABIA24_001977 [Sinorhizobium fredii]
MAATRSTGGVMHLVAFIASFAFIAAAVADLI